MLIIRLAYSTEENVSDFAPLDQTDPQPERRRRWYSSRAVVVLGTGLAGLMVAAVGCSAQSTQGAAPVSTVTMTATVTATATATVTKKAKPAPTVTVTEPGPTKTETSIVERTVEAEPEDAFEYEDDSETQNFSGPVTPDGWDCPDDAPIKGNASSMIYHTPDGSFYDKTNPEECFASESDARAAGYRASKR